MLASNIPFLLALLHLAAHTPAAPISSTSSPLKLRTAHCANAPSTVAGSFLSPRALSTLPSPLNLSPLSPSTLHPRFHPPPLWCAPHSHTYITITLLAPLPSALTTSLTTLLRSAQASILSHIASAGDGLIANGLYNYMGELGVELNVRNANNHQVTYGVLRAACVAVEEWMAATGLVGEARFQIFDGGVEVGWGRVG